MKADGSIVQEWEDRLRELFPHDLPAERAVYILTGWTAGPNHAGASESLYAYTSPSLDLQLQPRLESLGLWKGRGFCMVVPHVSGFYFGLTEAEQFGTVLHEFSHHVADLTYWTMAPGFTEAIARARGISAHALKESIEAKRVNPPRWIDHDAWFTRAATHCWFRALQAGHAIAITSMSVAGPQYGLSEPWRYVEALGDELHDRKDETIRDILSSDAPEAFSRLWRRDTTEGGTEGRNAT